MAIFPAIFASRKMKNGIEFFLLIVLLSACAGVRDTGLLKYEVYSTELEQKVARGEIAQVEADNLKMKAYQEYEATRRDEEGQLMHNSIARQTDEQNQEMNAILRQVQ